jgi:CubicO group peptidase (beta-lactamase class C family)
MLRKSFFLIFLLIAPIWGHAALAKRISSKGIVAAGVEDVYYRIKSKRSSEKLEHIFQKLRSTYGFNGVVLITEKNHIIYKKAFGYADLQKRDSLEIGSQFQLASVSKQFTSMAIMMLQERGFLKYEDKVTRFYPDFPYPNITIRHLLTHRAGLADYRWFIDPLWPDKNKPLSNQEMMRLFAQHKPNPYFQTGTHHSYSNTGYAILAAIVEKISGVTFTSFMHQAVFEPLGMTHTLIYSKCENECLPGNVCGYERNGRWKAPNDCFNGITGDKNVFSTVDDLYLWDQALYSDKLVKQSTLSEAFQPGSPELKGWRNYGFGWRINRTNPEKQIVYHSGWWRGFRTFFMRNVTDQNSIIVLSNTVNYSINSLGEVYAMVMNGEMDSLAVD